jgi:hypothetical protein
MPKLTNDILIKIPREPAYQKMTGLDFERKMNPTSSFEIQYVDERLIRYRWTNEMDSPGFEKILLPETYTIFSQRKPKTPFLYSYFIYMFLESPEGTIVRYIQDFQLEAESKSKEEGVVAYFRANSIKVMQALEEYLSS